MNKVLIIFLLFISTQTFSQIKISGVVKDTKGESLIGVNISVKGSYEGATTNAKGEYNFETDAKDSIILNATYIGFLPQEKVIKITGNSIIQNFLLKEKINDLKAVVISAGAFEASDEKKGTQLKALDIVTTAGSNGDSYGALKTLPGTQQTNDREGLFVRGGTGSETQTFIDGTWVKNAFTASVPDLGARGRFNPFIFKGTVFSAGGYSALYGQALSSAVILETIDLPERSSANINASSVGIGASVQQLAKNKKSSYGIGYNYVNLSPYFKIIKQNITYQQAPLSHQIDANFRCKTSKTGIFKFYGYYNQTDININRINISSLDYEDLNKEYQDEFGVKNKNAYANISYKEYLNKTWKLNIGMAFSKNKDHIITRVLDAQQQIVADSNFYNSKDILIENENYLATSKIVLEKNLNNLNSIRFGGEYIYNQDAFLFASQNVPNTISTQEHYKAIFAESDIYITNDLAGKIGIRAEHSSIIQQSNIAPRASVAYKLKRAGQLSFAYGMFYQKPDQQYLYRSNQLDYQRADHYILNYQYQPKDRIIRLEAYYKNYHQLLKTIPSLNNNGKGYAKGIELFYRDKKSIKGLDFWISYSYIDSKRDFINYTKMVQPDFVANHVGSLVVKKFWTKYMFGINGTYTYSSGRPYINRNETNVSNFMQDKTMAYHNVSLSANYIKTIRKAFTVFVLSVNNPFGFKQVYGYNYAAKDLNNNGNLYRKEITPAARQFVFIGMFMSLGIDRTQEAIDNNL
jgi:hypothetical protein